MIEVNVFRKLKGQLLVILMLVLNVAFASANSQKDSLILITQSGSAPERYHAFIQLADHFEYDRSDSAYWASQNAVSLAHQINDFELLAEAYKILSVHCGDLGLYELAIENLYTSIAYYDSLNGPNKERDIASAYHKLAWHFADMEDLERPLELFHTALKMYPLESTEDSLQHAISYHALGSFHYLNDSLFDSAIYYLKKTVLWHDRLPMSEEERAEALVELSNALILSGRVDSGRVVIAQLENEELFSYSLYIQNYVVFLRGLGLHQEGKYAEALPKLEQVYQWCDSTELIHSSVGINLMRQLTETSRKAERFDKAYQYLNRLRNIERQTIYKDRQRTTKALEFVHETSRKEQQIESQNQQLSLQRLILWGSIIGLLVVSGLLIWVYRVNQNIKYKNRKIETLIRELHHRVKNNLQVISSLLGLQSMKMEDSEAKRAVEEGKSRVRAMAMIHQKLYKKEDLIGINFNDYVIELITELKNSYYPSRDIKMNINIPDKQLDVDTTLPLGLIINEMVSNAFKYAFTEIDEPLLEIEFKEEQKIYKLTVSDNGGGMDKNFDISKATSFGMRLINMLSRQLGGTLNMVNEGGLKYELVFASTTK